MSSNDWVKVEINIPKLRNWAKDKLREKREGGTASIFVYDFIKAPIEIMDQMVDDLDNRGLVMLAESLGLNFITGY